MPEDLPWWDDGGGFDDQPASPEKVKEVCRLIRLARSHWDAHRNAPCRGEREKALKLYGTLTEAEKALIPDQLKVWLRYRSEKYFGEHRTAPGKKKN